MARRDRSVREQNGRGSMPPWRWMLLTLPVATAVLWSRRHQGQAIDSRPAWSPFFPLANSIDRDIGWHRLPWPLGLAMVVALRRQLRRDNLHDPSTVVPSLPRPPLNPTRPTTSQRGRRMGRSMTYRNPRWGVPAPDSDATSPWVPSLRSPRRRCSPPIRARSAASS